MYIKRKIMAALTAAEYRCQSLIQLHSHSSLKTRAVCVTRLIKVVCYNKPCDRH